MTHLSPEQLVDVAEGRGERAAIAHAGACDACRASVEELRGTLALAQTDGQPEPSPLFWDHLSARVGAAVREEAGLRARRTAWVWRWGPATALGAAALVVALAVVPGVAPRVGPGAPAAAPAADTVTSSDEGSAPPDDASWMLMRDLSRELSADEAGAALPAGPGTADRALGHLNEIEREALVEIMREEIARSSAKGAAPSGE